MFKRVLKILLTVCLTTSIVSAAQDPFIGDWKLDASKSRFPDEFRVASKGGNTYAINFNGVIETIVANGSFQTGQAGTLLSVKREASNRWIVKRKRGRHLLLKATWTLSKDNRTLTDYFRGIQSDGSLFSTDYVYQRIGGGSGFAADWRSMKETMNSPFLLHAKAFRGDGLSFVIPAEQVTQNVTFERAGHPRGANVSRGVSSSIRRVDERTVIITNGKTKATEEIRLSTDLNTLIMTQHAAGHRPTVLVFKRE